MALRINASRFSVTRNLTCKGLSSRIQKIVYIKCSPCSKNGVHLQLMSAEKCVLLSLARFGVISIGFFQKVSLIQIVWYLLNFCWKRILEQALNKCEVCSFRRTRNG